MANLKLEVTPQITPSNVSLDVTFLRDSVVVPTAADFASNTKARQDPVSGARGTVVIGGIFERNEPRGTSPRVPCRLRVPFLGNLFRHSTSRPSKTELLIFLRRSWLLIRAAAL